MKVAIFAVQYKAKNFNNAYVDPVPKEFRSGCRIPLFYELIKQARNQKVNLVVLPGGFFRTDSPGGIASRLRHYPPKVAILVGRDNLKGNKLNGWVIAPNGSITRKIPEAFIYENSKRQAVLNRTDRRFQINNKCYSAYCCGDVIIDDRKFMYSKAAFVLAHYGAPGRSFTPSMRRLGIPTFLSHHVKDPYNTVSYAYSGKYKKNDPKPIKEPWGKSQGLKWIARIYSI